MAGAYFYDNVSALAYRIKENHEKPQDSWCMGSDLNVGLPKLKHRVLVTTL
jgi:hypothetical protein